MDNLNGFKIFLYYLKQHIKSIVIFIAFIIIFSTTFYLYNIPVSPILYASLLFLIFASIYISLDYYKYYKKHRYFEQLREKIVIDIEQLPEPTSLIEQDYTNLLEILNDDKARIISDSDNVKTDMINYYTIWAHQIKTPIAAMQLLLQTNESEDNKVLLTQLFKIEQYVEMVLSYLRLDSNTTDYVIKKCPLNPIINQCVKKYAPLFISKKISLELSDCDCEVLTDEKWLSFVIEQILSNALKYTSKGKISIYLIEPKTLVIEDTGIGIASEDLPRLCQKGFTGYNGRIDKKATGLGLYLCKRILTKLSHKIEIQSEVNVGTKVFIGLDTLDIINE